MRNRLHRWIRDGVTFVPVEVAMHERGRSRECIYRMARESHPFRETRTVRLRRNDQLGRIPNDS